MPLLEFLNRQLNYPLEGCLKESVNKSFVRVFRADSEGAPLKHHRPIQLIFSFCGNGPNVSRTSTVVSTNIPDEPFCSSRLSQLLLISVVSKDRCKLKIAALFPGGFICIAEHVCSTVPVSTNSFKVEACVGTASSFGFFLKDW